MSQPSPSSPRRETPAESPALDLTGRTLADFRVLRRLGQGGMGQVYLAEQINLKRKVALKIMHPDLAANPTYVARFKAEAEAAARTSHANIVQVYAFGEDQGITYIAMEYVEGRNLRDYLARKGPPDLLVALSIMRQVASALQRAGELGIVHRDIKPDNILLTRKSEVKVADFGLSRCLGLGPAVNLTQSGVSMGTPLYMAPEQVEGKSVDPRTDIYCFGVTCYHLLAGQPPFRGETPFEVALHHVRTEPPSLASIRPDLPEALCAVVHKMLAKDPAHRYQTARDLLRDILRVREGLSGTTQALAPPTTTVAVEPVSVTVVSPVDETPTAPAGGRLWPWVLLALCTLPLAAGAGAAFSWVKRSADRPPSAEETVLPADVNTVEAVCLPHKREQALREAAEQYLNAEAGKNLANGFGLCLDLGMLYLEEDRLDEAEKLYARLDRFDKYLPYKMLGHLGLAVVSALRNQAPQSAALFREVFTPQTGMIARHLGGKGGKLGGPGGLERKLRDHPELKQMFDNPQWRYWITRARWYNLKNGVDEGAIPAFLQPYLPGLKDPGPPPAKKA